MNRKQFSFNMCKVNEPTMNRFRTSMLFTSGLISAGSIVLGAILLPERVASHFGLHGQANGWMSKQADLLFFTGIGLGLPLLVLGLSYTARFFPNDLFNLPHKDYWLAPERRQESVEYVFRHSLWTASLTLFFLTWVNVLTIMANTQPVPTLSTAALFAGLALFVA